jgi:shikimate kinase
MRNDGNLLLVGPMGAGKSHVGRLLAERLGWAFVDVDARVVEAAGRPIPAIFAEEGEPGFRAREARALAEALGRGRQVIATGGGVVLDPVNRAALLGAQCVVYLEVAPQEQLRRLADDRQRPLLAVADPARRLADLQAEREPLYREVATLAVDTTTYTPERVAEALATLLDDAGDASP